MESLNDGVKANVLLLSIIELEDDVVVSPDLETIFWSPLSNSLTNVEHVLDSLLRLSTVVELEEDIVEEEVSPDLENIFFSSILA